MNTFGPQNQETQRFNCPKTLGEITTKNEGNYVGSQGRGFYSYQDGETGVGFNHDRCILGIVIPNQMTF